MTQTPDHKKLWLQCLDIIAGQLQHNRDAFVTWFTPAESLGFSRGKVTLRIPSSYFLEQYEDRFYDVFSTAVRQVYGKDVKIEYKYDVIRDDPKTEIKVESQFNRPTPPQSPSADKQTPQGVRYEQIDSQLNPQYNFSNYCVGESNRLAYSIAENLGSHPQQTLFNPFFLYGNTGVGKTHLIQAIGLQVIARYPQAKVLYTTSRMFENQYGTAVKNKRKNDFINFYQGIDVLLIDDIQELSGKGGTQDAFYPIFNFLHQKGKILVLTSDRPPVELSDIMDRLISRFKWGVIEMLPNPDLELRKQILRHKSAANGINLSEEVIDMIANHVTDSVRELEGVVISLYTRATLLNQQVTPELARVVMQSTVKMNKRSINFDMIVEATAAHFNIDVDVIFSRSRMRDINDARQMIMYLCHKLTDLSSKSIGYKLNRTHVTVLHGIKTIADRIGIDPGTAQSASEIEHTLRTGI